MYLISLYQNSSYNKQQQNTDIPVQTIHQTLSTKTTIKDMHVLTCYVSSSKRYLI